MMIEIQESAAAGVVLKAVQGGDRIHHEEGTHMNVGTVGEITKILPPTAADAGDPLLQKTGDGLEEDVEEIVAVEGVTHPTPLALLMMFHLVPEWSVLAARKEAIKVLL